MLTLKRSAWGGMMLMLSTGIIHISMSAEEYAEAPYLGVMFVGAFVASVIAAAGIYRQQPLWGWGLGALTSAGSIAGYLLSRTVGLPVAGIEPWGPAMGYLSLAVEMLFVVLAVSLPEFRGLAGVWYGAGQRRSVTRSRGRMPAWRTNGPAEVSEETQQ